MQDTFDNIYYMYSLYNGTGYHLVLFGCAVIFLLITLKNQNMKRKQLIVTIILLLFIFWFPPTAKIIMDYCIGADVYWRMLWLFPIPVTIAYAFTAAISLVKNKFAKLAICICAITIIVITGKPLFTDQNYSNIDNMYKLPYPTIEICDTITSDAAKELMGQPKILVENDLIPYIRQYNANICMAYGRDVTKDYEEYGLPLYEALNSGNSEELTRLAIEQDIDYLVLYSERNVGHYIDCGTYILVSTVDRYNIYRLNRDNQ